MYSVIVAHIKALLDRLGMAAGVTGYATAFVTLLVTLLVTMLVFALPVAAQVVEAAYTGCGGVDAPVIDDAFEARVVELVNEQRAANGALPPLKRVPALDKAARYHATDLGFDNYFAHDTYDRSGGLIKVCETFERIRQWYDWAAAGENIGAGYRTPEEVMAGWMGSDGHRRNILNANFREIGVGYFSGAGDYGVYWVQDLGARRGEYPVLINNDAVRTNDPTVELFVHGEWSEMRLRNDSDAWSEWQPFVSRSSWMLNNSAGERIVSVELRSGAQTYSACDKITLVHVTAAETATVTATAQPLTDHQLYLPSIVSYQPAQPLVTCE